MGNGIDPADTNEFEVALGVAADALALAVAEGDPPAAVLADEVLPDAAPDVLADAPHPASAITATPARTARADLNLLMSMPRSWLGEVACAGGPGAPVPEARPKARARAAARASRIPPKAAILIPVCKRSARR